MFQWLKSKDIISQAQLLEVLENFRKLTSVLVDNAHQHEKRIAHLENIVYGDNVSDKSESNS